MIDKDTPLPSELVEKWREDAEIVIKDATLPNAIISSVFRQCAKELQASLDAITERDGE